MDADKRLAIETARVEGRCPMCSMPLDADNRYGSGRIADGIFCSLRCFAEFHYAETDQRNDQEGEA